MTEHNPHTDRTSPVAGIIAAVVLILIGTLAPAWPVLVFGGIVLVASCVALAIRNRGAADALTTVRPNVTAEADARRIAQAIRDYERGRE